MAIKEKDLTTIGSVAVSDFTRTVTSDGSSTKTAVSTLAAAIVENYAGSSLGGSTRSIKSAIDSLNTNIDIDQEVKDLYESLGWDD